MDSSSELITKPGRAPAGCFTGAVAQSRQGETIRSDAFPPQRLVDTLAAGDTFNAAMIDALLRGVPLAKALRFACQLAGNKCAQAGLHGLDVPARGS